MTRRTPGHDWALSQAVPDFQPFIAGTNGSENVTERPKRTSVATN